MEDARLLAVTEIKEGDELLNLGIIESTKHYPEGKNTGFTILHGKCISAAFYWFPDNTRLWTIKAKGNSQAPVENSKTETLPTEKS